MVIFHSYVSLPEGNSNWSWTAVGHRSNAEPLIAAICIAWLQWLIGFLQPFFGQLWTILNYLACLSKEAECHASDARARNCFLKDLAKMSKLESSVTLAHIQCIVKTWSLDLTIQPFQPFQHHVSTCFNHHEENSRWGVKATTWRLSKMGFLANIHHISSLWALRLGGSGTYATCG